MFIGHIWYIGRVGYTNIPAETDNRPVNYGKPVLAYRLNSRVMMSTVEYQLATLLV